jgi:multiple sugar transport system substrate-binding protein
VAGALALSACGTTSVSEAERNSLHDVNLTWWTWTGNPQLAIANFEKRYPSIHVHYLDVGSTSIEYTKLRSALDAGSGAPDVVQIEYYELPSFILTHKLVNLAPYVKGDAGKYPAWVWNQVSRGKAVYAVPEDIGPLGLAYVPSLMSKYHLSVPSTWAEFAAEAAKLHREDPNEYLIESPTGFAQEGWLIAMFWQAGANLFHLQSNGTWDIAINTPTTRRVLQFWVNMVKVGGLDPGNESSATYDHNISQADYLMYWAAAWSPSGISEYVDPSHPQKFAVAQLPQWKVGEHASANNGGSSNAVTKQSPHTRAAALFASYINTSYSGVNVDLTAYQADGSGGRGLFPAATIRDKVPAYTVAPPDFSKNTQAVFNQSASEVNTSFEWSPWSLDLENVLGPDASAAASGRVTVAQALESAQKSTVLYAEQEGLKLKVES